MSSDRSQKIATLGAAAAQLDPAARSEFLRHCCAGDPELLAAIEEFLAAQLPTQVDLARGAETSTNVLRPGQILATRFRIVRMCGRGGMGEVYEAADGALGGKVALKTLRPELSVNQAFVTRFRREVKLARRVTHPNICRVFDVGYDTVDGVHSVFLTMEFLDGETLSSLIHRQKNLAPKEAAPLMEQVARGLAALHESGIIHRDLKPGNIMLVASETRGMRAVVTDFGLSRTTDDHASSAVAAAGFAGTPDYMSPEQLLGKNLTPASDVYALGLVMFELITGSRPFGGGQAFHNAVQRVTADVESPAKLTPGLNAGWESLILRCLNRNPDERPTMVEVAAALKADPVSGPSITGPAIAERSMAPSREPRRKPWGWIAAAFAVAMLAAGSWLWTRRAPQARPEAVVTRVTADAGLSLDPALSRDGKLLAYASDRAGAGDLDIWVQQIGGSAPIRLTASKSDESSPDFSLDGTRVIYQGGESGGGIYSVSTLGGEPMLLASGGHNPRYSPDGQWIAFWTGREGEGYLAGSAQLVIMPASGGESRVIGDLAAALHPVWSPDGQSLLCVGRKDATGSVESDIDWFIVPLDGKPARRTGAFAMMASEKLRNPSTGVSNVPLAWLDNPSRVVFGATQGDATNIYEVPIRADGSIQDKPSKITNGTNYEAQCTFGGTRLAYTSLRLNHDIWGIALDEERGLAKAAPRKLTSEESVDAYPSISWDGSLLAYRSRIAGIVSLRVLDIRSGKNRVLLSSEAGVTGPRISGDGSTVTYFGDGGAVRQVPISGGESRLLCKDCGFPVDAGRDSRHILLEPSKPPDHVVMLDTETGKLVTLAPERQVLVSARWSSDGKWIAFHEIQKPSSRSTVQIAKVGERPAPASEWIAITDGIHADRSPAWSPSGNLIYYLSDRDGFQCVYAQKLDAKSKRPSGSAFAVQHLHEASRSLKFLRNRDPAIGFYVGRGIAVLTMGELTGNIWRRD